MFKIGDLVEYHYANGLFVEAFYIQRISQSGKLVDIRGYYYSPKRCKYKE